MSNTEAPKTVTNYVLPLERWKHRLIIRHNPPADLGLWTEETLKAQIGFEVVIFLHGEKRNGYFLTDFEIYEGGKTAALTLDWYDLQGFVPPVNETAEDEQQGQADEGSDQRDEDRPNGDEGEIGHDL